MRILVTNDDGIEAEGIRLLASWAKKLGDVTVCAPKTQQSAKSHAISVHQPLEIKKIDYMDGVTAYRVDSTPVDCVRYATIGLNTRYDLVLSGVNKGYNLGEDILYSGTVGAIFETSLRGLKGIALSTEYTSFEWAEKHLNGVYDYFVKNDLLSKHNVYNVNIPPEPKGMLITMQGGPYFDDIFVPSEDDENMFKQQGFCVYKDGGSLERDTDAAMRGYISVMPLSARRDDMSVYEKLKKINK